MAEGETIESCIAAAKQKGTYHLIDVLGRVIIGSAAGVSLEACAVSQMPLVQQGRISRKFVPSGL
ncbi:hypothetical protein E4U21_004051 [Claviceps maximensis]|nr:hypothetical protein E4U21_004051 [Claviceps maximensis]